MKGLVIKEVNGKKKMVLASNLIMPKAHDGEVLVEIKSASVNPFDQENVEGRFDSYYKEYAVDKEVLVGLEFSGIIVSDTKNFEKGDRVFGYVHMITGWKTHAEYIAVSEDYIALMPDNVDFNQAASVPLGSLTTLVAFEDLANITNGKKVLINGASGGLGVQGIQVAKALGAEVVAIAGTGQESFLSDLGADKVYDYNTIDLIDLNEKFDAILDLSNKRKLDEVKHLLGPNGKFIPAEPSEENGGESESESVGYLMVFHGDNKKLSRISNWLKNEKIKPVIDKEYSFDNHEDAYNRVNAKGRRGRVVLYWK